LGVTAKKTSGFDLRGIFVRSVTPSQALTRAQEKSQAMRCSVHGKAANLRLQKEGGQVMISISTCCSPFHTEVAQRVFHE